MRDVLYALAGAVIVGISAANKGKPPITEAVFAFVVFWLILTFWRGYRERRREDASKGPGL